jgi:hypothetical protein
MTWSLALRNLDALPSRPAGRVQYDEFGRRLKQCRLCGPKLQPVDNFYRRGVGKWSALCKLHAMEYNRQTLRRYRARQKKLKEAMNVVQQASS